MTGLAPGSNSMEKTLENRRRVKLYVLNAARHWDDRGTGHVSAMYSDRLSGMSLIVRDEQSQSVLLESKIDTDTSYQKQQETLIVWSENDSDMALSFQEKIGCEEVWAKICDVQGKDPSVEVTQDSIDEEDDDEATAAGSSMASYGPEMNSGGNAGVLLPPCEMSKLDKIYEVVQSFMSHPHQRDKLATVIEQESYIKKLLDLFRQCEDLENTDGLQHLFSIMKSILMLNRNALYEVLFSDECIEEVLGCLEWDPTGTRPKRHREYIRDIARFKEVVPLENADLQQKIQQMYKVQYIQDVILPSPSVFEDNILNTLQSFVFFNKLEIVNMIQDDARFLKALFAQLISTDTPVPQRRDAILFLKEFCQFSHTLQPPAREGFFRMLMAHGILQAVQAALDVPDQKMRSAIVDVFTYIVELHPFVVREFSMSQAAKETDDGKLFFVHIIRQAVVNDPDPQAACAMQILTIMRLLLDPENMLSSPNKNEKTEFLTFFYKRCIPYLAEPILEVTRTGSLPQKEDLRTVHILNLILEFLSYCVEHHTFHIKNFIINRDLLTPILILLQSSHQFLVVAVVRFLRKIIGLNEDFYNRYIIKGDHLKPVIEAFLRNGRRYNLLNSAVLELFEHIRTDDIRMLIIYVIGTYWERLSGITYTGTFSQLHLRYNIHTTPPAVDRPSTPDSTEGSVRSGSQVRTSGTKRFRRDERDMDEDEEHWFENDDGDESNENNAGGGGSGTAIETSTTTSSSTTDLPDETGSSSSSSSNGVSISNTGETIIPKLVPLMSVRSITQFNAAPPVKRPILDDLDDDDSPFGTSAWRSNNSRLSNSNKKVARNTPSPTFRVNISSSSVDSTRELGASSPGPSSSSSSSPNNSNTNGSTSSSSPPGINHVTSSCSSLSSSSSTSSSLSSSLSPSSTLPWEASLHSVSCGGDSAKSLPQSLTKQQSALLLSSSNVKPPSPSLVCYPDDEEEDEEGTDTPLMTSQNGTGSPHHPGGSGDAPANPLERQEVTS
ncbi:Serine/threonine-protein phosphatase 4 regulatory subunit 3 [Hypsibius exemplaris]|uniref:Serine/threonine-protein phosphatase 4 regulatory subunit 3 n=1 Tax=Hypsibius exemplaris TaxID=2072580 RepID=A0A1W0WUH9_HYPEX|nr:Serine/threonine-protein phosphatase 4 regulatory subunit 3 [Hypsibius exemplaris]